MRHPLSRLAGAMLVAALASGCFSFDGSFGEPIATEHLESIEPGRTTRAEITAWFGPPSAYARPGLLDLILADDGAQPQRPVVVDVYSYRHVESHVRVAVIPLILLRARAETRSEALTVFFDEDGVVRYYGYRLDTPDTVIGAADE